MGIPPGWASARLGCMAASRASPDRFAVSYEAGGVAPLNFIALAPLMGPATLA
jgi:hypothetical protein